MARQPRSAQFWRCMAKVRQVAGENLTDSELEELAERLLAKARIIRANRYGMSADEATDAALKAMTEEAISKGQLQRRAVFLNNTAFTNVLNRIQATWADDPRQGLTTDYVGSNVLRRGSQRSIDADQKGLAREWVNGFAARIQSAGKWKLYATGALDADVYKALDQMYKDNPSFEGIDRDAREFAQIIFDYQELYRVSANNAGAFVKRLADYITAQSHDQFKVRKAASTVDKSSSMLSRAKYDEAANYAAWREFVLSRLDEERTFDGMEGAQREGWLRSVWLAIASGEHLKSTASTNSGYLANAALATKVSAPRILHFKNAEARFEYDTTFGRGGSLLERVMLGLQQGGHTVALMRRLGPNPDQTHNRLKMAAKLLTEKSVEARSATGWREFERTIDAYYDELTGEANTPGLTPVGQALRSVRSLQTVSKLGAATLSSIVDTAVAASELRYQGFSAIDAWHAQLSGVFSGYGRSGIEHGERLRAASELGVAVDYLIGATWSRFSATDALAGWQARATQLFFKANGLQWWTDTLRMANAQAMSHRFAMMATRNMAELDASAQRIMALFDITSTEWDLMRSRAVSVVDGKEFFSPKAAERLTDVEIAYLLKSEGKGTSTRAVATRREEIKTKFRDIFAARSDYAVIVPGPKTHAIMRGGTMGAEPGSFTSELYRSFFQFKGFPAAIIEKVWGREIFGHGPTGNFKDVNGAGMGALASFMVYSTFLGFVSLYLKAYFNGRELKKPEDPKDYAKLFGAAFMQGGGAGLYGDFLFGAARDRYGHSALGALLGPSWGLGEDAYSAFRDVGSSAFDAMFDQAKEGNSNAGGALNAVKSNAPFINLFYTRLAMDYLFWFRLQEYANPGSLKRVEKSYEDNLNQQFKLPPSQNNRVEDLDVEDIGTLLNPF